MKKHKIAAALVCVVFFTGAWGAVAAAQTLELVEPPPYEWEPWHNVYEPPSFYLGPGELVVPPPYEWEPWHNAPDYFPINEPGPPFFPVRPFPVLGPEFFGQPPPYEGWEPWHPSPAGSPGLVERPLPPFLGDPPPYEGWEPWHHTIPPIFPIVPVRPLLNGPGPPPLYEGWEPWHHAFQPPSNDAGVGVPEPGSLVLLIGGGLCLLGWAWRRRHRR